MSNFENNHNKINIIDGAFDEFGNDFEVERKVKPAPQQARPTRPMNQQARPNGQGQPRPASGQVRQGQPQPRPNGVPRPVAQQARPVEQPRPVREEKLRESEELNVIQGTFDNENDMRDMDRKPTQPQQPARPVVAPVVEEPIVEETVVEEPVVEDVAPVVEEPIVEETVVEEVAPVALVEDTIEETAEDYALAEDFADNTKYEEPVAEESVNVYIPPVVASENEVVETVVVPAPTPKKKQTNSVSEDEDILKLRYKVIPMDRKICMLPDEIKGYYSEIKNLLLSYKGVKSRVSKKFDTFSIGRFVVAKISIKGDYMKLYLALRAESLEHKYYAVDVSHNKSYAETPTLHAVKSKRDFKYAQELITMILDGLQIDKDKKFAPVDYTEVYASIDYAANRRALGPMIVRSIDIEGASVLSDEQAVDCLEEIDNDRFRINKFYPINKYCVFTDQLDKIFPANANIDIQSLIGKGVLPNEMNIYLEVRARGELTKPLYVQAHSFDMNSIKMILLTNGSVKQYKK